MIGCRSCSEPPNGMVGPRRSCYCNWWGISEDVLFRSGICSAMVIEPPIWGCRGPTHPPLDPGNRILAAQDFRHSQQMESESVKNLVRRLERTFQTVYGRDALAGETRDALLHGQFAGRPSFQADEGTSNVHYTVIQGTLRYSL